MRPTRKSITLLVASLLAAAHPLHAQAKEIPGSYTLVGDGGAEINRAIDEAVARMSFVVRPIARGRLRKTNVPYRRIRIDLTGDQVRVVTDTRHPVTTPADGTMVRWRREDGEVFEVRTEWKGEALEQTFVAPDGKRLNRYVLAPDGATLFMEVTVTSPRLDRAVVYTLRYRREG